MEQKNISAAIFDDRHDAERAVSRLREAGVPDRAISVIGLHDDGTTRTSDGSGEVHDSHDNKGTGIMKGLGAGGALGAIAGLGALAIPGVGPFIAAGALAETLGVAGSAAVASGAVGAAAGGLTGALIDYGMDREDAKYYDKKIREGGTFVGVDTHKSEGDYRAVTAVLTAAGGRSVESERTS